jgi:hypothetical protein
MPEPEEASRGGWTRRVVLCLVPSSWALWLVAAAAEPRPMPRPEAPPQDGEVFEAGVFEPGVFE